MSNETWALDSARRLEALSEVDAFPGIPEEDFDTYTRLVVRLLGAPAACITFVTDERQYFPSNIGLADRWKPQLETPLDYSLCQYVVTGNEAMVVSDAVTDPRTKDNLGVTETGVGAYLGVPLRAPGGEPLGTICAFDGAPREWSEADIATMHDLAEAATALIALRVSEHRRAQQASDASHNLRTPLTRLRLELDDLALAGGKSDDVLSGVEAAVAHVDDLAGLVDGLLNNVNDASGLLTKEVSVLDIARKMASRMIALGTASESTLVVEGEDVTANVSSPVLSYVIDELMGRAVRVADGPVTVSVTEDPGLCRVQFLGNVQESAKFEPSLAESLIHPLRARAATLPSPGVIYELVLSLAVS